MKSRSLKLVQSARDLGTDLLLTFAVLCLAAGAALAVLISETGAAAGVWTASTWVGLGVAVSWTVIGWCHRRVGVDVVAVLALAGTLLITQPLAGAIIVVMLAGGRWLEARAGARSRRDLALLVERAPRRARRLDGGVIEDVDVSAVAIGDTLLIGNGEIVAVDGSLLDTTSLDESALTGEPMPVIRRHGEAVRSGVVNLGRPTRVRATALAQDSSYALVVRLAEQAQASSAPFVRTADRVAAVFVPFTVLVAGAAWAFTGTLERVVAVLVVATPCPLLLAAPIAVMSGLSRAARLGVVVKGGDVLERLGGATVLILDKTGTITFGRPELTGLWTAPGTDEPAVLRLAAALEKVSTHPLAAAVIARCARPGDVLPIPTDVEEHAGSHIQGVVDEHRVTVGRFTGSRSEPDSLWVQGIERPADLDGRLLVWISVDGRPSAALAFDDVLRPEASAMVRTLRSSGIRRVVLATGDRLAVATPVARAIGADLVEADLDVSAKMAVVQRESSQAMTIMVGDGINDAPALAAAGIGVALGSRGATASSEAADVVLLTDRIDVLAQAVILARRTRTIALQAVVTGMGLSVVSMGFAAAGLLPPVAGAAVQEVIDVLAMVIALRNLRPGPTAVGMQTASTKAASPAMDGGSTR